MFPHRRSTIRRRRIAREGLTLAEMIVATAVMAVLAGTLSGLAMATHRTWTFAEGHETATQHGRVVIERISRAVTASYATADYPGFAVATQVSGLWSFPDTLVVWTPDGAPANADGPPLVSECVMFTPDPDDPSRLLEITAPTDNRAIPLPDELSWSTWLAELEAIKTAPTSKRVVLTDLLRVGNDGGMDRGVIRFERTLRPSTAELDDAVAGTTNWEDLDWPQGLADDAYGLRQSWLQFELQLVPGHDAAANDPDGAKSRTFFGSVARWYPVTPVP